MGVVISPRLKENRLLRAVSVAQTGVVNRKKCLGFSCLIAFYPYACLKLLPHTHPDMSDLVNQSAL